MKLVDLKPRFLDEHGSGRVGVAVSFECPCGCVHRCCVMLANPLDGGPDISGRADGAWKRTGDAFETLTLEPSIQRREPCPNQWHGWITNGEVKTC